VICSTDFGPAVSLRTRGAGFTLLEFGVVATIYGVLLAVFLDRLLYYQEAAEKARMEYVASTLKVALQVHIGTLMAEGRSLDYAALARENPVSWLEQPMPGYVGELTADGEQQLRPGQWYFDAVRAELIYVPSLDRYFVAGGARRVHWHVQIVRPPGGAGKDSTAVGLRFAPVEPYRWF
jgi:general secretion pathway protein G